ncbi:MAG TPA: hypothetical protein QF851_04895 [Flavobacteriales bacterium]|jgi:hypothetical protein|nr:hypothetical protein [Flavobacteriales bacterium]
MRNIIQLTIFFSVFCFSSCYYDIEEELYPPDISACDTTNITDTTILDIFDSKCNSCHSGENPMGEIDFTSIQQIEDNITLLLNRINLNEEDNLLMPPGSKLSNCNINKITSWSDGL